MKFRFGNRSIHSQLALWFAVFSIVPLIIVAFTVSAISERLLREDATETLVGVAEAKKVSIQNFIAERQKDVTELAQSPNMISAMAELTEVYKYGISSEEYAAVDAKYRPFFSYIQNEPEYYDLLMVSEAGDVIFTVIHESDFGTNLYTGPYRETEFRRVFEVSKTTLRPTITDFGYYEPSGIPATFVGAPVFKDNVYVGTIALQLKNQEVYNVVQNYSGLGETGEVLIAMKSGNDALYLAPLRFDSLAAFNKRVSIGYEASVPIQQAVQGKSGTDFSLDYRDEEVLATWQYLPDFKWGMVAKIDKDEIFAPLNDLRLMVFVVTLSLFLIIVIISFLIPPKPQSL